MLSYDEKKFLSIYKLVFNKNFCPLNTTEGISDNIQASNLFYILKESMIYPMDFSYHFDTYGMMSPGMNIFIRRISRDKIEDVANYYRTNKCYTDKIIQKDIFDPRLIKLSLLFNLTLGGIYNNTYTLHKVTGFSSILYIRLRLYSLELNEDKVIERACENIDWINKTLLRILYPYVDQFIMEETSL